MNRRSAAESSLIYTTELNIAVTVDSTIDCKLKLVLLFGIIKLRVFSIVQKFDTNSSTLTVTFNVARI